MSDTQGTMTVKDFLRIRQHVANLLAANSNTQPPTRLRQAENLMAAGVIDVEATLEALQPKEEPREEQDDV